MTDQFFERPILNSPGVNHSGNYGRWSFAEFTEVYQIEADFEAKVESEFNQMIDSATVGNLAVEDNV